MSSRKGKHVFPAHTPAIYVGVDPGNEGGVAILYPSLDEIRTVGAPELPHLWAFINTLGVYSPPGKWPPGVKVYAMLEQVGGYHRGKRGNIGSAMFEFGRAYGWAEAVLVASGFVLGETYFMVRPQVWQKAFGLKRDVKGGEEQPDFKKFMCAVAQDLFPGIRVTAATGDALLIAEYCRQVIEREI
jgi:hypothetical protein